VLRNVNSVSHVVLASMTKPDICVFPTCSVGGELPVPREMLMTLQWQRSKPLLIRTMPSALRHVFNPYAPHISQHVWIC
jgi:hypothetical protein